MVPRVTLNHCSPYPAEVAGKSTWRARWTLRWLGLLLVLLCVVQGACRSTPSPTLAPSTPAAVQPARFVTGDEIELRVYGEDELGGKFQVQDDGAIEIPLVGRVLASGLTQAELTQELRLRLQDGYLKNPQVTVVVTHRRQREVSVLGHVASPGRIPFVDELTLVQAISEAGGFAPSAQTRRLKITRKTASGVQSFEVSVQAITRGQREDLPLQPGDIIFVPQSPL